MVLLFVLEITLNELMFHLRSVLGVPLTMSENTTGELTLASNSYATSITYTKTQVDNLITIFQTRRNVTTVSHTALSS